MPEWVELSVRVGGELAEGVAEALAREGGGLVEELVGRKRCYRAYLAVDDTTDARLGRVRERIARLRQQGLRGEAALSLRPAPAGDWEQAWKAHFGVQRIAPNLVIVPSWESYQPAPPEAVVVLDPGMAFGTGEHPTTRACLAAMARRLVPGWRVIDVGTGSGILAIAAAKLGASRVLALEIDPSAAAVARGNVRRNGVSGVVQVQEGDLPAAREEAADLVVANIVAEALVALAPHLPARLRPGGCFIGAGITAGKQEQVAGALAAVGLGVQEAICEGEWVSLVTTR